MVRLNRENIINVLQQREHQSPLEYSIFIEKAQELFQEYLSLNEKIKKLYEKEHPDFEDQTFQELLSQAEDYIDIAEHPNSNSEVKERVKQYLEKLQKKIRALHQELVELTKRQNTIIDFISQLIAQDMVAEKKCKNLPSENQNN